jgi:hypothetical protein
MVYKKFKDNCIKYLFVEKSKKNYGLNKKIKGISQKTDYFYLDFATFSCIKFLS